MAENDQVSIHAGRNYHKVIIHRVHEDGHRTLVGYYSPEEAEDIGVRIIREAGVVLERIAVKNKQRKLKSAA